jgi:D-hydroxyproline dehydrogenase subunit alpha
MSDARADRRSADVAVIGAGPAGIAAAVSAAGAGKRVVLLDESPRAGGQIWRHIRRDKLPRQARTWLARLDASEAAFLPRTSVVDIEDGRLTCERPDGGLVVEAEHVILATGARERFLPFDGWTLPGVVGVGGAQALLKAGTDVRGRNVVVAGSGPLMLPVAAALARAGARLALVAEQAPARRVRGMVTGLWRSPARLVQAARYRGAFARTRYAPDAWVERAAGDTSVRAVTVREARRTRTLPCDLLCVGYGLVPATELARLIGADVADGAVVVDDAQRTTVSGVFAAGEPTGIAGVDSALTQGEIAGRAAAGAAVPDALLAAARGHRRFAQTLERTFALREELRALPADDTFVCRCEDVRFADCVAHASTRSAKLHTRAGMGPCQARVCGPALEFLFGWSLDSVRPPALPARVSTLLETRAAGAAQGGV